MPFKDKQRLKEYQKVYQHQYYLTHKEEKDRRALVWHRGKKGKCYVNQYYEKRKVEVIAHYSQTSMACAICGFNDIRALSIDHKNSDGAKHRRSLGISSGFSFYLWLIKQGFPKGFQVLCMNCQTIKRNVNNENKRNGTEKE